MKLIDKIKNKLASINLVSVAFFALSIFSIAFAWFAYTNTVSTNFQANVKTWKIEFLENSSGSYTQISNEININVNDLYPGMDDFRENYSIQNQGDIPAVVEHDIKYLRIFDEEIDPNNLSLYEINKKFPFKMNFLYTNAHNYMNIVDVNDLTQLTFGIEWGLDTGNDELDTQYGNMAYEFYKSEKAKQQANPNYQIRSGFEMKLELKATQYVDETNSFATDSWRTIQIALLMNNTSKYHVGDTKQITVNGKNYTLRLVNKSSNDSECSGTTNSQTACGFVIEFLSLINDRNIQSGTEEVGGWSNTNLHDYLNDIFFSSLPYEIKKVIATTRVVSSHTLNYTENLMSSDKIYLLSTKEIYGKSGTTNIINFDSADSTTRQLDYYQSQGVTTENYSGAQKEYSNSIFSSYWTRSAVSRFTNMFFSINGESSGYGAGYGGSYSYATQMSNNYISPVFRIRG